MDRLLVPLRAALPLGAGLVAALIAYNALIGQVALQADLAGAMGSVATSVHEVRLLTAETAQALAPLGRVTADLRKVNQELTQIVEDLTAINGALGDLNQGQATLAGTLGELNVNLEAVGSGLAAVDLRNQALLSRTQSLATATGAQADAVDELAMLTIESVDSLRVLNRRLAFLAEF